MSLPVPNNAILWNAAVGGLVGTSVKGRWLMGGVVGTPPNTRRTYAPIVNSGTPPAVGVPDPSYEAICVSAIAGATAIDGALPNDHVGAANPTGTTAISVVTTGVAILPAGGTAPATTFAQIEKELCLKGLVTAILEGRAYPFPTTGLTSAQIAAEFANIATLVSEAYDLFATVFVQPQASSTSVNNQLLLFAAYNGALAGMLANNPALANGIASAEVAVTVGDACGALAVAVDALVANDITISGSAGAGNGGVALSNQTAGVFQAQLGKTKLMFSIAMAAMYNRNVAGLLAQFNANTPAIAAWATQVAAVIGAGYNALVAGIELGAVALNNPTLYNEAYSGFIAGNLSGTPFTTTQGSSTSPTYNNQNFAALAEAAAVFATELDTTVGAADVTGGFSPGSTYISTASEADHEGTTPGSGTLTEAQLGKTDLMWAICRGVNFGRPLVGSENPVLPNVDTTAATYSGICESIVALYLEVSNGTPIALNMP